MISNYSNFCIHSFVFKNNGIKLETRIFLMSYACTVKVVIRSKRFRWANHVARMEEGRSAFKILVGTPAGNRPLGRPRRRWEDNIRMDLIEIGINTRNWVDSA